MEPAKSRLPAEVKARLEAATASITKKGALGVLIPGGFILTATHCIDWSATGRMVLGEYFLEDTLTKSGAGFRVSPVFADPLSDLAALAEADNQELPPFSETDDPRARRITVHQSVTEQYVAEFLSKDPSPLAGGVSCTSVRPGRSPRSC